MDKEDLGVWQCVEICSCADGGAKLERTLKVSKYLNLKMIVAFYQI